MSRVCDLIEEHLSDDLCLETIAGAIGVSPRSLPQAYLHWGSTVCEYVPSRRVERAKSLLLSIDLAITSISLDTGFSSQSHLATVFRRVMGLTPKSFRPRGRS